MTAESSENFFTGFISWDCEFDKVAQDSVCPLPIAAEEDTLLLFFLNIVHNVEGLPALLVEHGQSSPVPSKGLVLPYTGITN